MNALIDNLRATGPDYERAYAARWESTNEAEHREAVQTFTSALFSGVDEELKTDAELSRKRYPVSSYLGEPSREARGLLFQACHKAQQGDNVEAGHLLRKFIERVANEYADDHAGAYL